MTALAIFIGLCLIAIAVLAVDGRRAGRDQQIVREVAGLRRDLVDRGLAANEAAFDKLGRTR